MSNNKTTADTKDNASQDYPGVAINIADKDKVDAGLIKDEIKSLNNNPRNTDN